MRVRRWLPLLLTGLVLGTGCGSPPAPPEGFTVAVSILPQAGIVERLGGGRLTVVTAVAPGQSPTTFDPSPRHMGELATAGLYFACGVPMESLLLPRLRASYPDLEIVDTTADLARIPQAEHGHGAADPDAHEALEGELDPHLWLDPRLLAAQVEVMAGALARRDPAHAADYGARGDSLTAELAALDDELRALLAPVAGRDMFVFHPAYGYFARAYGLKQVAIEQGGIDPSPRHLAAVLAQVKAQGARAVFVQPQFSWGSARAVARETGVELVVLDPLARDYAANLRRMARAIREALDER